MNEDLKDRQSVYEIGYLIASSVAEEKVPAEVDALKQLLSAAGAVTIADEMPHKQHLAYTIRRKTVAGSYDKFDSAYFGWVKFEVGSDKIEALKKAIEVMPSMLRILVITTVAENTYLGKRAAMLAAELGPKPATEAIVAEKKAQPVITAPASVEDMDKSIDEMVKEV